MSWGIKIIISFIIFAAGVAVMVAVSMKNDTDLVAENYYEKEIKYQNEIDMLKRSIFLKEKIKIRLEVKDIIIEVEDSKLAGNLSGEIYFYRTNDEDKDFIERINFTNGGMQKINTENMNRGLWKLRLNLIYNSEKYFIEERIFLE